MHEFNDWKQLRVKAINGDDPDWVATQTVPPIGTVELGRPGGYADDTPIRLKVEIVLEWLDTAGDLVLLGRGGYSVEALRVATRRDAPTGTVVVDSAKLTGQIAHRPVIIDDLLVGDQFTVRLSGLQPPHETAIQARILYREIV